MAKKAADRIMIELHFSYEPILREIVLKRRSVQSYGSASTSHLTNPFVRRDK